MRTTFGSKLATPVVGVVVVVGGDVVGVVVVVVVVVAVVVAVVVGVVVVVVVVVFDCSGELDQHLANGAVIYWSSPALVGVAVDVGVAALFDFGVTPVASMGSAWPVGLFAVAGCWADG